MSWRENAIQVIGEIHATLPENADLKARRKALRDGRPHWFGGTSWGRKVWAACARDYLRKHGQDPGHGRRKAPESPMERMVRRAEMVNAKTADGRIKYTLEEIEEATKE